VARYCEGCGCQARDAAKDCRQCGRMFPSASAPEKTVAQREDVSCPNCGSRRVIPHCLRTAWDAIAWFH